MFHVKHSIPSTQTPKEYKGISFCGIETYQRHHIPSRTLPLSVKVYLSAVSRPINVIIYLHGHSLGPLKVYLSEECYDTVCHHIPSRTLPLSVKVYLSEECYDTVCLHIPSRTVPGSAKGIFFCGIETSALDPDIPSRTQFLYFLRPPINPHKRPVFIKTKNRSSTFRLPWHESLFPHVLSYPYIRPNEANHES